MKLSIKKIFILSIILIYVLNVSGCKTLDNTKNRKDHVDSFKQALNKKTINQETRYTLDDCLREALQNNLNIKAKQIEKNISSLNRKAAFSYLLPRIDLNFQTNTWSKEPLSQIGNDSSGKPMYMTTHEDSFNSAVLNIGFPILTPSAWFLYSMRKKNEDISDLSLNLTKQMISMRVTALYFTIIGLERTKENIIHRIKSAKVLNSEISNFYLEGLVPEWKKTRGEAYLLSSKKAKKEIENAISERKSELLLEMGYSPLLKINIEKTYSFKIEEFKLKNLIYDALISHPALYIQDSVIAMQKDGVKAALADFLPNIIGYANLNKTTNSFVKYSTYWISGIQGIWSLFNGFKNLNDYKIAKKKHELEFIKREEACLSTMLTVTKAYLAYQNSLENLKVTKTYLQASHQRLQDVEAKWKEGMETNSNYYEIAADLDYSKTLEIQAEIMLQVSIANLYSVRGKTYMGKENINHE